MGKTKNKAIFLDRDGTINKDTRYVFLIEDMKILPDVVNGLKRFQKLGYKLIVITNQSGIARGYYTLQDAERFDAELARRLEKEGIIIEKFYQCPHHPDFTDECDCRKPKKGLVVQAAKEFDIDPEQSLFVGDMDGDILLGRNCGGTTFRIKNNIHPQTIEPDYYVANLEEMADIVEKLEKANAS